MKRRILPEIEAEDRLETVEANDRMLDNKVPKILGSRATGTYTKQILPIIGTGIPSESRKIEIPMLPRIVPIEENRPSISKNIKILQNMQ